MDTPHALIHRTVLVAAAPAPERRLVDEHGADPNTRGMSWITGRARIIEILRDAIHARNTQLQIDGSRHTIRIHLDSVRVGATRSLSGAIALECRPEIGDFVNEPWAVGGGANIWFADATGIYSFRVKIVGGTRTSLMVNQPASVVRYCRRTERRFIVPGGELPRVALPLTDGTWWEGTGVRDLSTGGLRLALPPDVQLPLGRATRLGLGLHPQRFLEMTAVARHMQSDENNGLVLYGLEFVEPSSVARMAIARFTGRLTEDPMPDDEMGLPGLPPAVALQLKTARHDGLAGGVAVGPAPVPSTAVQAPRQLPTHIVMHR
jgi:hypothetical protein